MNSTEAESVVQKELYFTVNDIRICFEKHLLSGEIFCLLFNQFKADFAALGP